MRFVAVGLSIALLMGSLLPAAAFGQDADAPLAAARAYLQQGKPLEGFVLLCVENLAFGTALKRAGFGDYLEGLATLASVQKKAAAWPQEQQLRLARLTDGFPLKYSASAPVHMSWFGNGIQLSIVDPARDPALEAFLQSMKELGRSQEFTAQDKIELIERLVDRRIGGFREMSAAAVDHEKGSLSYMGARLTGKAEALNPERVALLRAALEAAGFEASIRFAPYFENSPWDVKPTGVWIQSRGRGDFVSFDRFWTGRVIVEAVVDGDTLVIRKNSEEVARLRGALQPRESAFLEKSPQVRFTEYPAGRAVHLLDDTGTRILTDGVVEGPEADGYRVRYGGGKMKTVSRVQLDLFNGAFEIPDGAVIRAGQHFVQRDPTLVRAEVGIDARQDSLLRAFEAEMELIGRAKGWSDDAKLNYANRVVNAWLTPNYWSLRVANLERVYVNGGEVAPLGAFMMEGQGLCRHVALLATRGLQVMGYHSRYSSGNQHANANVQLADGRRLKVDPYYDAVLPLTAPKAPSGYLSEILIGERTLYEIMGGQPKPPSAGQPSRNTGADDLAGRTDELFRRMYDGRFTYAREWNADHVGKVPVERIPVELAWFNPTASVPELGIEAGRALTPAQKKALETLFGVGSIPGRASEFSAPYPSNVGRAINPSPDVLGITIGDGRHQRGDLTTKGGGTNKANNPRGDGTLALEEALLDAEISLSLQRAGVKNYMAFAVFRRLDKPGKGLYVRMPTFSIARADDLVEKVRDDGQRDKMLTPEEALRTVERAAAVASRIEGRSIGVREFLEDYYPRTMGENAGRLRGLGLVHGTVRYAGYGNSGIAETVDWGSGMDPRDGAELTSNPRYRKLVGDRAHFERDVRQVVEGLSPALPAAISLEKAIDAYYAGYASGKAAIRESGAKVVLNERFLREAGEQDLRNLVRGLGVQGSNKASKEEVLRILADRGVSTRARTGEIGVNRLVALRASAQKTTLAEAKGSAKFAAAYMVKEGVDALLTKDPDRLGAAAQAVSSREFWISFGTFVGASRAAEQALKRTGAESKLKAMRGGRLTLQAVPLAAGMTAAELLAGEADAGRIAVSTGSFLGAGYAVNGVGDKVVYAALRGNRLSRTAEGVYQISKLAATLFAGEKGSQLVTPVLNGTK